MKASGITTRGWAADLSHDPRRADRAHHDLALDADVPHPGLEGDDEPGRRQRQRHPGDQRVGDLGELAQRAIHRLPRARRTGRSADDAGAARTVASRAPNPTDSSGPVARRRTSRSRQHAPCRRSGTPVRPASTVAASTTSQHVAVEEDRDAVAVAQQLVEVGRGEHDRRAARCAGRGAGSTPTRPTRCRGRGSGVPSAAAGSRPASSPAAGAAGCRPTATRPSTSVVPLMKCASISVSAVCSRRASQSTKNDVSPRSPARSAR